MKYTKWSRNQFVRIKVVLDVNYPPILTRGKRVAVAEVGRALHTKKRTREEESQMRSDEKASDKQEAKREARNTIHGSHREAKTHSDDD